MPIGQFTYTAMPLGKGYNPSKSGYQVKACSDSISSEQREWLEGLCMHYGDTVYRAAPKEAIEKETSWRTRADDPRKYPAEVLDAFPEAIVYNQVDANHHTLVKVKYTGLTYDDRPGNFLAYALVFEPGDLQPFRGNALTLARSGILDTPPDDEQTHLPDLPDLGSPRSQPDLAILSEEPYRSKLTQMLAALLYASPQSKPVVLLLPGWHQAQRLLEALISLLPVAMQKRTTFCTYESERDWLPAIRGQRPPGMSAAHHLLVLGARDPHSISLRPDEIQNRFAVFNFIGEQFSPVAETAFASWAAGCILDGKHYQLDKLYQFLDGLGFSQAPGTWEALFPLFELDRLENVDDRARNIEKFAAMAIEHYKAAQALGWLEEHIVEWSGKKESLSLQAARQAASLLINALPSDDPQRQEYLLHLKTMALAEMKKGQVQAASLLLQLTGDERTMHILAISRQILVEKTISLPELPTLADKERWLDLLFEAMAAGEKHPDQALATSVMITAIFQAAEKVNRTSETWNRLGKPVFLPYLQGEWDREKQSSAAYLLKVLDPKENAEAVVELGLRMAEQPGLGDVDWRQNLQLVARAAGYVSQPDVEMAKLVELVERRSMPAEERIVLLAILLDGAHAVRGREKLARAYDHSLADLKPNQRNAVRREIAKAHAWDLLAQEFFSEVLVLKELELKKAIQQWRDVIFIPNPEFQDRIYSELAARLHQKPEPGQDVQSLVFELLPKTPSKPLKPGLKQLYEALVMKLPLTPAQDGQPLDFLIPDDLSPQATRRKAIIEFLVAVQQQSTQADWSLERFAFDQAPWSQDVRSLPPEDRIKVLAWLLATFQNSGVTQPSQARALIKLLHNIDMLDALGEVLSGILQGRDAVTWALAGTAVVDYGVKLPKVEDGARMTRLALGSFNKDQLRLTEDHLWKRFNQPDSKIQEKMVELCKSAGLSVPKGLLDQKAQAEGAQKEGKRAEERALAEAGGQKDEPAPATKPQQGVETVIKKSSGMFAKIGGLFQSSEPKKTPKNKKE